MTSFGRAPGLALPGRQLYGCTGGNCAFRRPSPALSSQHPANASRAETKGCRQACGIPASATHVRHHRAARSHSRRPISPPHARRSRPYPAAAAAGIVFANKAVFQTYGFHFTYALTWIHTVFTLVGMRVFAAGGMFQVRPRQHPRLPSGLASIRPYDAYGSAAELLRGLPFEGGRAAR